MSQNSTDTSLMSYLVWGGESKWIFANTRIGIWNFRRQRLQKRVSTFGDTVLRIRAPMRRPWNNLQNLQCFFAEWWLILSIKLPEGHLWCLPNSWQKQFIGYHRFNKMLATQVVSETILVSHPDLLLSPLLRSESLSPCCGLELTDGIAFSTGTGGASFPYSAYLREQGMKYLSWRSLNVLDQPVVLPDWCCNVQALKNGGFF